MQTKLFPSDVIIGQYIQLVVYALAIVCCYVYTAGYMLGDFVHRLNDRLAKQHVSLINFTRSISNALQL